MKKASLLLVGATALAVMPATAQTTLNANNHGILGVSLPAGQRKIVSLPFVRPASYLGTVTSVTTNTLTVSLQGTNLTTGVLNESGSSDNNFQADITSGQWTGLSFEVISNTGNVLTVRINKNGNGLVVPAIKAGTTVSLRKSWNLGALFGVNNEAGLAGDTDATTNSTRISIYNPANGAFTTHFFWTDGPYWADSVSLDETTYARLDPAQTLFVQQAATGGQTVFLTGEVRNQRVLVPNVGGTATPGKGGNRISFVGNYSPFAMTLGSETATDTDTDSGLFNANSPLNSVTTGASDNTTADEVNLLNASGTAYVSHFYDTDQPGWADAISLDFANTNAVGAGIGFQINRKSSAAPFSLAVNPIFKQ